MYITRDYVDILVLWLSLVSFVTNETYEMIMDNFFIKNIR
jgi:hypothetical protein